MPPESEIKIFTHQNGHYLNTEKRFFFFFCKYILFELKSFNMKQSRWLFIWTYHLPLTEASASVQFTANQNPRWAQAPWEPPDARIAEYPAFWAVLQRNT